MAEEKYPCLQGEFGSGKTRTAVSRCVRIVNENPGARGFIIRNIDRDLRDSTVPQFFLHYCGDENIIPDGHIFNKTTKVLQFPNRFHLHFIALDRPDDSKKLKNLLYTFAWIEQAEEIDPLVFQIATPRARQQMDKTKNTVFLTANNEEGSWINDYFYANELNVTHEDLEFCGQHEKVDSGLWQGKSPKYIGIREIPLSNRMNVPEDYYEDMIDDLPTDLVKRYVFNKAIGRGGYVYNFTDENIIEKEDYFELMNVPFFWEFFQCQDYGISETNPMVWLWCVRDGEGTIFVVNEYYEYGKGIDHVCNYVDEYNQSISLKSKFVSGCPRTFQKEGTSDKRPADLFPTHIRPQQFSVHFDMRQPILAKLIETKDFKVFRRCENLIKELKTRKWNNIKTAVDHATEAIERGVVKIQTPSHAGVIPQMRKKDRSRAITAGLVNMEL